MAKIEKILKKQEDGSKRLIYPATICQAIRDGHTGATLEMLLAQFNSIYVQYNGSAYETRNLVPSNMRRAGLVVTYMNMDGETISERAVSAAQADNDHWGLDVNWTRIDQFTLSGRITISANGTWLVDGEDTDIKAVGPKGDTGLTPWLKTIDNKLHFSYDNVTWEPCSENIAAWFRFNATSSDSQAGTIGRVQISRDNKTWTDLSPELRNFLRIQGYVATASALPIGQVVGTIYGVGPTYATEDSGRTKPIYRLYVWNGSAWVDNGQFTSIAAGVTQETGNSETLVMSQKAVTEKLSDLASEVIHNYRTIVRESNIGSEKAKSINYNIKEGVYRFAISNAGSGGAYISLTGSGVQTKYVVSVDGAVDKSVEIRIEGNIYTTFVLRDYSGTAIFDIAMVNELVELVEDTRKIQEDITALNKSIDELLSVSNRKEYQIPINQQLIVAANYKAGQKIKITSKQSTNGEVMITLYHNNERTDASYIYTSKFKHGQAVVVIPKDALELKIRNYNTSSSVSVIIEDLSVMYWLGESMYVLNKDKAADIDALFWDKKSIDGKSRAINNIHPTFLVSTDIHSDSVRFSRYVEMLNTIFPFDGGICLGDIALSDATSDYQYYIDSVLSSIKPIMTLIGNHEVGSQSTLAENSLTEQDVRNIFFSEEMVAHSGVTMGEGNWWKKDILKPNYRDDGSSYNVTYKMIGLHDFCLESVKSDGNYNKPRGSRYWSQAQIDWLIDELESCSGATFVCVLSHQCITSFVTYDDNVLTGKEYIGKSTEYGDADNLVTSYFWSGVGEYNRALDEVVCEIIDAWIYGKMINKTYSVVSDDVPDIVINHSFTNHKKQFIGYINGHSHRDFVAHPTNYPEQKIIALTASVLNGLNNSYDELPRNDFDVTQDAVTAISFDVNKRQTNIVRVGSDVTSGMTSRRTSFIKWDR